MSRSNAHLRWKLFPSELTGALPRPRGPLKLWNKRRVQSRLETPYLQQARAWVSPILQQSPRYLTMNPSFPLSTAKAALRTRPARPSSSRRSTTPLKASLIPGLGLRFILSHQEQRLLDNIQGSQARTSPRNGRGRPTYEAMRGCRPLAPPPLPAAALPLNSKQG